MFPFLLLADLFVCLGLWHINLCWLFNAKLFYTNEQFYSKQLVLDEYSLTDKNISSSSYLV